MKKQAEGFSLIEVIIAIAILAIISMSLLSYFTGANRYANDGKSKQRAEMAAQSAVEELASCSTMQQIESKVAASGSAWRVIATPQPAKNEYQISRPVQVDGVEYTARVKLDFASYQSTARPEPTPTTAAQFNRYKAPQIEQVYSPNHVVLEETDQTKTAVGDIFAQIYKTDKSVSQDSVLNGLHRTMHIDIVPCADSTGAMSLYLIKGYYNYRYEDKGTSYECQTPVKDVKIEKDALKKIYLFYRPVNKILTSETLDIAADRSMPAGFSLTDFSYYAVMQKDTVVPPAGYRLDLTSGGNPVSADLKKKWYTNANPVSDVLITHKQMNRIAMVTVEIYDISETDFSEKNRIVMLQTSKGV